MAVVLLGGGVSDIRGSIGGTTFSRNKGGNYARSRTKPVNPRSTYQESVRARMGRLTRHWSNTLTEQERIDWRAYAGATSWTNRLGQSITINGLAAFIRLNSLWGLADGRIITAAPTATGHAAACVLTFLAESDTTKIQVAEPVGGFVKNQNEHYLFLFQGQPVEKGSIALPKGFVFLGFLESSAGAPPTFPKEYDGMYTVTAGQRVTVRAMYIDPQNRVSGPTFSTIAAAPSI